MASDNITDSFGGEQLGRFNTPKFEEDSTEVVNKPITSAQQAFEVFTRLQRDNQARANRNKLITDSYNGGNPFDQKKLDAQKAKIDQLAHELDLDQREYRLRAVAYYGDAGTRLRDKATWDKDETRYKDEIESKQKSLDDAKTQLSEMQEEVEKLEHKIAESE